MRLSSITAARLPEAVERFDYDRGAQRIGIVHLGVGAFHRAHQAMFTDRAMSAGDRDWAILGASLRSPAVRDALVPQDGLYTVTARDSDGERTRLIGAVRDVVVAGDGGTLRSALASPDVAIVTMTVTEKGYHRRPDGSLDIAAVERAGDTLYRHLAQALADRRAEGRGGLTLLSCDNIADNGGALARSMTTWLDHVDPPLARWFAEQCACPSTMVDRIVPAATAAGLDAAEARLGLRDEAAILTEPFAQWVIEDRFAGRRPGWEKVGAQLVGDVAPYETAKLRMLNGAHSALAYLGLRAGHAFVHQAIADPAIRPGVEALMRDEAAGSFDPAPGQDLSAYADALLARFGNTALPHALRQIAMDGSQKISQRWLASLHDNAARGRRCPATLTALAAWLLHVRGDGAVPVDDPRAEELATLWAGAGRDGIIAAMFGPNGAMAGPWRPDAEDRTILARAMTALDQR